METGTSTSPKIQTGCAQPYVAVLLDLALTERTKLAAIVDKLTDWLTQMGIKIAGPLFYRYHTMSVSTIALTVEVGYPVATEVQGSNGVVTGLIPKGNYATLIHCGNADAIHSTFKTMQGWAGKQGIAWKYDQCHGKHILEGCFQFWLTDPADGLSNNQCRTALALLIDEQTSG